MIRNFVNSSLNIIFLVGRIARVTCGKVCCKFIRNDVGIHATVDLYNFTLQIIVSPVLEYACVVWNHNLPTSQSDKLESVHQSLSERVVK